MTTAWSDHIGTVLDACRRCGATDAEREHALALLGRWQSPERAVAYVERCRDSREAALCPGMPLVLVRVPQ